jgi:hypothetical protein
MTMFTYHNCAAAAEFKPVQMPRLRSLLGAYFESKVCANLITACGKECLAATFPHLLMLLVSA